MMTNWNSYYATASATLLADLPSTDPYNTVTGVAYWQWATSYFTRNQLTPPTESLTDLTTTVVGYPEYYSFITQYCNPDIGGGMSADNYAEFGDVEMFRDTTNFESNMEYIFALQNFAAGGGDPPANSLFNITTL